MFRKLAGGFVALALVGFAPAANADVITGLYSTGVDSSGVTTTTDAPDLHWKLNGGKCLHGCRERDVDDRGLGSKYQHIEVDHAFEQTASFI